jgi:nicotinamidase-related amidase
VSEADKSKLLDKADAVLLVIDIQERFRKHIVDFGSMVRHVATLVKACRILSVPVLVTEQYSQGLGRTVPELLELLGPAPVFEKNCFSVSGADGLASHLDALQRKQIIVCGIETHVCVNQSVHHLMAAGYQVHLIEEALGARVESNKRIGLAKMYQSGAHPSSVEMALFEMLKQSGSDEFKAIQNLVK